eukprot:m.86307 g.86307  ORF g.86307 m.86307 type:complete len:103 (-) comp50917_c0_seq9:305-613(-)
MRNSVTPRLSDAPTRPILPHLASSLCVRICSRISLTILAVTSGNNSRNVASFTLNAALCRANASRSGTLVMMLPAVGVSSSMKLSSPFRMLSTVHAGFQLSG